MCGNHQYDMWQSSILADLVQFIPLYTVALALVVQKYKRAGKTHPVHILSWRRLVHHFNALIGSVVLYIPGAFLSWYCTYPYYTIRIVGFKAFLCLAQKVCLVLDLYMTGSITESHFFYSVKVHNITCSRSSLHHQMFLEKNTPKNVTLQECKQTSMNAGRQELDFRKVRYYVTV